MATRNALKTGIDAEYHAFSGEDKSALAELTAEYDREYQPMGAGERLLVDQLVKSDWFLRRYRYIASPPSLRSRPFRPRLIPHPPLLCPNPPRPRPPTPPFRSSRSHLPPIPAS